MQVLGEFFVDPFVMPVYFFLAAYGIVWLIAFGLARLFMNKIGIDRASTRAWRIAFAAHILFGTGLAIWICARAIPRVSEWWHTVFYVLLYFLFIIVDVCCLIAIPSHKTKS